MSHHCTQTSTLCQSFFIIESAHAKSFGQTLSRGLFYPYSVIYDHLSDLLIFIFEKIHLPFPTNLFLFPALTSIRLWCVSPPLLWLTLPTINFCRYVPIWQTFYSLFTLLFCFPQLPGLFALRELVYNGPLDDVPDGAGDWDSFPLAVSIGLFVLTRVSCLALIHLIQSDFCLITVPGLGLFCINANSLWPLRSIFNYRLSIFLFPYIFLSGYSIDVGPYSPKGAAMGRTMGEVLAEAFPNGLNWFPQDAATQIFPGGYAVVGKWQRSKEAN